MSTDSVSLREQDLHALADVVRGSEALVALSGAGCSTGSGIPDYRDADGEWKRHPPMRFQRFVTSDSSRKRYWARAMLGWELVQKARPNDAHRALSSMEQRGKLDYLITQNVDGLHQKAGSRRVNDLHGRIDRVQCLGCGEKSSRDEFQSRLLQANPSFAVRRAGFAPDGDADLDGVDFDGFEVPPCSQCSGVLKPDVVFFGESVPRERVDDAMARVDQADALVVVGSSLMVWSGYRFVKRAVSRGLPVVAVNLGKTRADAELRVKVRADCGEALAALLERLETGGGFE